MSAGLSIAILFSLSCPAPCVLSTAQRGGIEQAAIRALTSRGFEVRPAPKDAIRATSPDVVLEPADEADKLGVSRVLILDYEAGESRVWITHYVRGTVGPWSVSRHRCDPKAAACAELEAALMQGLRPRSANDVDFVGMLRRVAPKVGGCVLQEDRVEPALRLFGRVEMDLEVSPEKGQVAVTAIAPARAARGRLGACLRRAMATQILGPFKGEPVEMRIPVDL